jgi:hypothetical protein
MNRRQVAVATGLIVVAISVGVTGKAWTNRARRITVFNVGATPMIAHYMQDQGNTWHTTISNQERVEPGGRVEFWFRRDDRIVVGAYEKGLLDGAEAEWLDEDICERVVLERDMVAIEGAIDAEKVLLKIRRGGKKQGG